MARKATPKLIAPSHVRQRGRAESARRMDKFHFAPSPSIYTDTPHSSGPGLPEANLCQLSRRGTTSTNAPSYIQNANKYLQGHDAKDCTDNRILPMQHVPDKAASEAWKDLKVASDDKDITDFKEAMMVLVKSCPELTYPELEKQFRAKGFSVFLIAMVRLPHTYSAPQ